MQMAVARDAAFPEVPTALEVVHARGDRQMFEIAFAEQAMGRPFVLPPGVPRDRVVALRSAFDAAMKDGAFLDDAKLQHAEIDPISGEEINALLERVYTAPADVVARIRELAK
jgi:tripartite-type tricarboxylate transporter receptor subunit TctC